MAFYTFTAHRGVAISSIIFGLLGLFFCWLVPLGIIFSLTGVILGLAGWIMAARRTASVNWMIVGLVLSVIALIIGVAVANGNYQAIDLLGS
jgi:hypothetical protein